MVKGAIEQDFDCKSYLALTVRLGYIKSFLRTSQGKLKEVYITDVTLINRITQKSGAFNWLIVRSKNCLKEPFLGLHESMSLPLSAEEFQALMASNIILHSNDVRLLTEITEITPPPDVVYSEVSSGGKARCESADDVITDDATAYEKKDDPPPLIYQDARIDSWLRTTEGKLREVQFTDVTVINERTQQRKKFDLITILCKASLHEAYVGLFKSMYNAAPSQQEIASAMGGGYVALMPKNDEPSFLSLLER